MKFWKIDSTSRVVEQMPKRGSAQQPTWRKYILAQYFIYYRNGFVAQCDHSYSLCSVKKSSDGLDNGASL
jgi:hypothetical protein